LREKKDGKSKDMSFAGDRWDLASGGEGAYEGSSTNLPRRRLIIPAPVVRNLHDLI
jgi:hypothetical protein